jgi:ceramide glucosyltransferase
MLDALSIVAGVAAAAGCAYLIAATVLIARFARTEAAALRRRSMPAVTILKPLHGVEPGLFESLLSFCTQDYPGAVQVVFGVQDPSDEAIAVVERLRSARPDGHFDLVVDATMHGQNRKVSNLVNMSRLVEHDIVVLADADMRVDPDYLARVVAALEQSDERAVTCLYHGVPATGVWSDLAALGINGHFLPSVVLGMTTGLAHPCSGSTIALRRAALADIGGFASVANCLADDYAIGAALRARSYVISVPPVTVAHVCGDRSMDDLWHHEVRWGRTIRSIDPIGYAGSIVTHAVPLALVAALSGLAAESVGPATATAGVVAALLCRMLLLWQVARAFGLPPQSYWLIPLRDVLSLAVFLASWTGQDARWKGRRYRFASGGSLVVARSSSKP